MHFPEYFYLSQYRWTENLGPHSILVILASLMHNKAALQNYIHSQLRSKKHISAPIFVPWARTHLTRHNDCIHPYFLFNWYKYASFLLPIMSWLTQVPYKWSHVCKENESSLLMPTSLICYWLQALLSMLNVKVHENTVRKRLNKRGWFGREKAIRPTAEGAETGSCNRIMIPNTAANLQENDQKKEKESNYCSGPKCRHQPNWILQRGLKITVQKQMPANLNELEQCCREKWAKIPPQ